MSEVGTRERLGTALGKRRDRSGKVPNVGFRNGLDIFPRISESQSAERCHGSEKEKPSSLGQRRR